MGIAPEKQDYQQIFWDIIGIGWRRKFWVLIPSIIGISVAVYLLFTLPKIYQSSTLILIEAQKVPQSIVQSAVSGTAEDRLSTIKQQILSRTFLLRIIDKFGLYQVGNPSLLKEILNKIVNVDGKKQSSVSAGDKIEWMRKAIEVRTKGARRLESFSISFVGRDPETVMNVTNELSSLVIEENLKIRETFIEGATDFLNGELQSLKKELERQEERFGNYKRVHIGELPEQLGSNLRALDRFQLNLDAVRLAKKATHDRISNLERMYKVVLHQQKEVGEGVVLDNSLSGFVPIPQSPLRQKLGQYREALASLLVEYNDTYPDVISLKRQIQDLEKQFSKAEVALGASSVSQGAVNRSGEGDRPIDTGPAMSLLEQIRSANDELKDLEKRERKIEVQIEAYELRVENTPRREQEMVTIQRDYNNISGSYQSLLEKKLSAEISENLEKRQKGEQFRIIDPANLPEKPIKPNKMLIMIMGSALGLGMGIGLAFIREQFDGAIRKPEEVERITSVLVLETIPDFEDEVRQYEKQKGRKVVDIDRFSSRKKYRRRGGANKQ